MCPMHRRLRVRSSPWYLDTKAKEKVGEALANDFVHTEAGADKQCPNGIPYERSNVRRHEHLPTLPVLEDYASVT